jgi:hypothetical protein
MQQEVDGFFGDYRRVRNLDDVEVNCDEKLALSSQPGGKL